MAENFVVFHSSLQENSGLLSSLPVQIHVIPFCKSWNVFLPGAGLQAVKKQR